MVAGAFGALAFSIRLQNSVADSGFAPPKSIAPTQVAPVISSSICSSQRSCHSIHQISALDPTVSLTTTYAPFKIPCPRACRILSSVLGARVGHLPLSLFFIATPCYKPPRARWHSRFPRLSPLATDHSRSQFFLFRILSRRHPHHRLCIVPVRPSSRAPRYDH